MLTATAAASPATPATVTATPVTATPVTATPVTAPDGGPSSEPATTAEAPPAEPVTADAPAAVPTTLMTPATGVAARTDRRPVAGGIYDPQARATFITWAGAHEDNYIQAYDHRAGTWSAPVRVGDGGNDSHNYPTIVQADDGHLLVFRGLHNTELRVARSEKPHSIEGTWTDTVIPQGLGATYPMPFKADNGAIFVFIRETARDFDKQYPVDFRPMKYVRSTDNGRTWQSSGELTGDTWNIAPQGRPDNMNEIYIGQLRHEPARFGRPERVAIVYTLAGGGPEGKLHDRYHKNLYYTYFTPGDLHFHAAGGADLGTRVDDAEQERYLKIVDTPLQMPNPRSPDYISLVGSTLAVLPFVVWMQVDAAGTLHDWTAVHTPGGWRMQEVATGVRVRDMEEAGPLTWRVYATVEGTTSGVFTYLLNLGIWWRPESVIATPRGVQRLEVIGGYRDPAHILMTGGSSGRDVSIADGGIYVRGIYVAGRPRG
jgi:hypothetical protein